MKQELSIGNTHLQKERGREGGVCFRPIPLEVKKSMGEAKHYIFLYPTVFLREEQRRL